MYTPPSIPELQERIKNWAEETIKIEEQRLKDGYSPISSPEITKVKGFVKEMEDFKDYQSLMANYNVLFYNYCKGINESVFNYSKESIEKGGVKAVDSVESIAKLLYTLDLGMSIVIDLGFQLSETQRKMIEQTPIEFEFAYFHLAHKRQALLDYLTPFNKDSYRPVLVEKANSEDAVLTQLREEKQKTSNPETPN